MIVIDSTVQITTLIDFPASFALPLEDEVAATVNTLVDGAETLVDGAQDLTDGTE